jgi:hypothetical protein
MVQSQRATISVNPRTECTNETHPLRETRLACSRLLSPITPRSHHFHKICRYSFVSFFQFRKIYSHMSTPIRGIYHR